ASTTLALRSTGRKTAASPAGPTAVAACSLPSSASAVRTSSRPWIASRAALPRLQAAIPPGIDITVMTDRTQTIRASIEDVQVTMAITVVLVVIVIFLFLGDIRATTIVSVTVPMSLVGACAAMYLLGYSLDNLSLMGLTIAVGFVVD